jgi:hypothetical protein
MNAADYYGLDELKQACSAFIESCITVDTVCALLATAERYIQYKCTKVLVQKVVLLNIFGSIPLFLFSTHKQGKLSQKTHNSIAIFSKNLIPWRDSNPGLLSLRLVQCPLCRATRAVVWIWFSVDMYVLHARA